MKKILVVEDELAYLELLKARLDEEGYEVEAAVNGKEGLEKAKEWKPDLVLLDIRMPVMDGMTMLGLLRKEEVGRNMKVILLTNFEPDGKIIEKVVDERPDYYFVKSDITLDVLLGKIKESLEE